MSNGKNTIADDVFNLKRVEGLLQQAGVFLLECERVNYDRVQAVMKILIDLSGELNRLETAAGQMLGNDCEKPDPANDETLYHRVYAILQQTHGDGMATENLSEIAMKVITEIAAKG